MIALLGPLTGGSANPARQFGPALLAREAGGTGPLLWAYVAGPVLGAVAGSVLGRRLDRQLGGRLGARLGDRPVSPRET
ncbi:aquaporin [Streptomyces nanshensis]|uniref:aquaporin n=1 Tax=Streptomyces nanshensis TaxID=518642 RepID=UPI000872A978|nr:aquaporin [Streptomyces nanshensis]